jgi:hypothetical protein
MYITHFIGFLFNRSLVLIANIKVGTCNTKNEKPKPLTENSADPVKIRTVDKISQSRKKNAPQPINDLKTIWLTGDILTCTYNAPLTGERSL